MTQQITFKKQEASGESWKQVWYNVFRDGVDTGFSAFQHDGHLSLEKGDRWEGDFQSLDEVRAFVTQRQADIGEQMARLGLLK